MSFRSRISNLRFQIGAATLLIVAVVYLLTYQNDICSNPSEYTVDSGEYQLVLSLWGTAHHTGAPTYSMLGAAFVSLARLAGIAPAAGAALFSVLGALVGLGFVYALAVYLTGNPWASGAGVLALALGRSFWINSVIAEQRSFLIALEAASLWLAVRYAENRSDKTLYVLAFVYGQAVVQHRLAVVMAPALAILVVPGLARQGRRMFRLLTVCAGLVVLAFAFYLYMPVRAWMGAWTYGDPGSWDGFWFIFWAREVTFLMNPPANLVAWLNNLRDVWANLVGEWSLAGLAAAGLGLIAAVTWDRTRRLGWALIALVASFALYLSIWHEAVTSEKVVLWMSIGLGLALALGLARVWRARNWLGVAGCAALIALAAYFGLVNRDQVWQITRDTRGREIINLLKAEMPGGRGGVEPTLMAMWGGDYFAPAYASLVTGELRGFRVVDHRADFGAITRSGSRLITFPQTIGIYPKSWWRARTGGAYLSSVGMGLLEIGAQPTLTLADVPPGQPVELGDGIALIAHQVKTDKGRLRATVYWQAIKTPSQNYSVMVHLSDQRQITQAGDLIAQADSDNPVYNWYPTLRWGAGEIVREDYSLDVPPGKTPRLLVVGMYTRDASGAFHNLGVVNVPVNP